VAVTSAGTALGLEPIILYSVVEENQMELLGGPLR
jgi:hypothetical protein